MSSLAAAYAPEELTRFAQDVLEACEVPGDDARLVADSLVQAELWGHPSHGVLRLPWYVNRLQSGVVRAATEIAVESRGPAIALVDGRDGMGQVVATRAASIATELARATGVGVAAVRNSNHFGMAAYYTRMAAAQGCVGVLMSNASPAMAPWGGRAAAVGNNPWSIAVPAGRHGTATLDIANTVAARGKIHLAKARDEEIPEGWALDSAGRPTTDPVEALAGVILPMGGHKGYAISFMVDVLAGVLTGAAFGGAIGGPYQSERRSGCGHLFLALDIARFQDERRFAERMEALIDELRAVPRAPGVEAILFPGEPEALAERRHRREGLTVAPGTLVALDRLAHSLGLNLPIASRPSDGREGGGAE